MEAEQNESVKNVWIDEQAKIASFHRVEGYHKHIFKEHEAFMEYLRSLQQRGFRFQ